jgi:hypothetical protein
MSRTSAALSTIQKVVRFTNTKIIKKDLVKFEVVVLASMDKHMLAVLIQDSQHAGKPDDFGPSSDYRQDFKFAHGNTMITRNM